MTSHRRDQCGKLFLATGSSDLSGNENTCSDVACLTDQLFRACVQPGMDVSIFGLSTTSLMTLWICFAIVNLPTCVWPKHGTTRTVPCSVVVVRPASPSSTVCVSVFVTTFQLITVASRFLLPRVRHCPRFLLAHRRLPGAAKYSSPLASFVVFSATA